MRGVSWLSVWLAAVMVGWVNCQDESQGKIIFGVGVGVVVIGVFFILGVFLCIYGKCTSQAFWWVVIGTLLPILVTVIIWFLPKQAERPKKVSIPNVEDEPTSFRPVFRWIFVVFIYLMAVVAVLCLLLLYCAKEFKAYRVDTGSSSFADMYNNEREEEPKKPKRDRSKFMTAPQIELREYKESRAIRDIGGHVDGNDPLRKRRREDILRDGQPGEEGEALLDRQGELKNVGKNRALKLKPMDKRPVDMGIELNQGYKKRKLNMVNPEQRTVKIDDVKLRGMRDMLDEQ